MEKRETKGRNRPTKENPTILETSQPLPQNTQKKENKKIHKPMERGDLEAKRWLDLIEEGKICYKEIALHIKNLENKGQITAEVEKLQKIIIETTNRLSLKDKEGKLSRDEYINKIQTTEQDIKTEMRALLKGLQEGMEEEVRQRNDFTNTAHNLMSEVVKNTRQSEEQALVQKRTGKKLEETSIIIRDLIEAQKGKSCDQRDTIDKIKKTEIEILKEIKSKECRMEANEKDIAQMRMKMEECAKQMENMKDEMMREIREIKEASRKGHEVLIDIKKDKEENISGKHEGKQGERIDRTYAEAMKGKIQRQNRTTYHSLIINSVEEDKTGEQVFEEIKRSIDEKEDWCEVIKVKKTKNQKVIISCAKNEEAKKLKSILEEKNKKLNIEHARNRNPLIIVKNIKEKKRWNRW
ncbi:unnamed protein product [Diatraea saccharalis]|uniref:Uncharacterized protein n=1 Tax=Diatraea saccharalis TaxID=40085 RepID=A0A9N9QZM3_9NEOP|nr:unnamed protein product [Diatraea saccharalis]